LSEKFQEGLAAVDIAYNNDNTKRTATILVNLKFYHRLLVGYGAVSSDYNGLEVFLQLDKLQCKFHIRCSISVFQSQEGHLELSLNLFFFRALEARPQLHGLGATFFYPPYGFRRL
jgi:hypothetical protein